MFLNQSQITSGAPPPLTEVGNALDRLSYILLWGLVFLIPWGEEVPHLAGMLLANLIGSLAIALTILRTLIIRYIRKLSIVHYWMLTLIIWVTLSLLWTHDYDGTLTRVPTYLKLLIFVWIMWELAPSETRVHGLIFAYVLGSIVGSGDAIYNVIIGQTAAMYATAHGIQKWDTGRYSAFGMNENDFGLTIALSVPMIFYLIVSSKSRVVKLLCWLQLGAGFTAIVLTAGRGPALAAAVGFIMFPLTISQLPRWQRLMALPACAVLFIGGAFLVPTASWTRMAEFGSEVSSGTLTHRTVIWAAGLQTFRDRPFLGIGAGAYAPIVGRVIDTQLVAHNTFLSVLVELGIVGASIMLGLLVSLLYSAWKMSYVERCLWITTVLGWAVGVSSLTWEYRKPTWLVFGLLVVHAYSRRIPSPPWHTIALPQPMPPPSCASLLQLTGGPLRVRTPARRLNS